MMVFATAIVVVTFLISFNMFAIVPAAMRAISLSREAVAVMGDKSLSDEQKETAVQKAAISMLGAAASIAWRIAAVLLACVAATELLGLVGFVESAELYAYMLRVDVIVVTSVAVVLILWLWAKIRPSGGAYSAMDQFLHRIAFAVPGLQTTASDIEDTIFKAKIDAAGKTAPIFITSLPRAGTTVVLNALNVTPNTATHLYRDMPFVMAPILWGKFTATSRKDATLRERAHGDGLKIGFDSPEAFEEVIWKKFWPAHYRGESIKVWDKDDKNAEFTAFMKQHMRKLVALRGGQGGRYLSKNNANIARLGMLEAVFPDADIVIPLRHPAEHAASLLRQHQNFLEQHAKDKFVRKYMRDIGHLEFGELHQPIAFPGFATRAQGMKPDNPDYWLAYWIGAMEHVRNSGPEKYYILPEAQLQKDSQRIMVRLCEGLGLDSRGIAFAKHIKWIPHRADPTVFDQELLKEALELYGALATKGKIADAF